MLPENEERIPPKAACSDPRVMASGKLCSLAWYYRHTTGIGARNRAGEHVVLETEKTTSGLWTSREAIGRFLATLNCEVAKPVAPPPADAALRELAVAGIA